MTVVVRLVHASFYGIKRLLFEFLFGKTVTWHTVTCALTLGFLSTSALGQSSLDETPLALSNLIAASQAICYDYDPISQTCLSVSFFERPSGEDWIVHDVALLPTEDRELLELLFGETLANEIGQNSFAKLLWVEPINIGDREICYTIGEGQSVTIFESDNAAPWILEADRPIADVSDRIVEMFQRMVALELGTSTLESMCDVLSDQITGGNTLEFGYRTIVNGSRELWPNEDGQQTIRFHFSTNIPNLRTE